MRIAVRLVRYRLGSDVSTHGTCTPLERQWKAVGEGAAGGGHRAANPATIRRTRAPSSHNLPSSFAEHWPFVPFVPFARPGSRQASYRPKLESFTSKRDTSWFAARAAGRIQVLETAWWKAARRRRRPSLKARMQWWGRCCQRPRGERWAASHVSNLLAAALRLLLLQQRPW